MSGFSPDEGTIDITSKEVRLTISWKTTGTGTCPIQGQVSFRGKVVRASDTPAAPCRQANVRSVINDLVSMAYNQFEMDEKTTDLFRQMFHEIRFRVAEEYGIT
jgi:hypothetical protein